jgi:hypothetical protein
MNPEAHQPLFYLKTNRTPETTSPPSTYQLTHQQKKQDRLGPVSKTTESIIVIYD